MEWDISLLFLLQTPATRNFGYTGSSGCFAIRPCLSPRVWGESARVALAAHANSLARDPAAAWLAAAGCMQNHLSRVRLGRRGQDDKMTRTARSGYSTETNDISCAAAGSCLPQVMMSCKDPVPQCCGILCDRGVMRVVWDARCFFPPSLPVVGDFRRRGRPSAEALLASGLSGANLRVWLWPHTQIRWREILPRLG